MAHTVIYRKHRNGNLIALFPEIPADHSGRYCVSYTHIGQHGAADYNLAIRQTGPATYAETRELATELEALGYMLNAFRYRATADMHAKRRKQAGAEVSPLTI